MNTTVASQASATSTQGRVLQLSLAGLLGLFITGFTGFAHIEAVHNAAHDYRHSLAFPCH